MTTREGLGRWLSKALFDNLGLKFVSLLCAIGFFVFIRGSERAEMRFDVGITHTDPPESAHRILVKEPPTNISVTLRGPRTQLETLPRDLGTITLDLSTGHESNIELTAKLIPNLPQGVEVVQLFPQRIEVRWDDVIARDIPISVKATGMPKSGHKMIGDLVVSPTTVTATGPRTLVELLQIARVGNFDLSDLDTTTAQTLPLDLPPQGVEYSVRSVEVTAAVAREEKEVPFKAVRVDIVGAPRAITRPETVTVKIRGIPEIVSAVEVDQIVPYVELPFDVDLSKSDSRRAKVILDIPNVSVEIEPKEVLVKW